MAESRPIRVVYADDDDGHRTGLLRLLVSEPGIDLVAVAVDRAAALRAVVEHRPDVLLAGLGAPERSAADLVAAVAAVRPPLATRVLVVAPAPAPADRGLLRELVPALA